MSDSKLVNEEIDLFLIFKTVWKERKFMLFVSSICLFLSIGLFYLSPKYYQSEASFFLSSEQSSNQSFSQYSSLLGLGGGGNLEGFVNSILKSNSIQKNIAKKFRLQFKLLINEKIREGELKNDERYISKFIIEELDLKRGFWFEFSEDGLFTLFYLNQDKELSQLILKEYLKNLILFNESLDFSAVKKYITVIDEPSYPLSVFKPNLIIYSVLGLFFGLIVSLCLIYIRSFGYLRF